MKNKTGLLTGRGKPKHVVAVLSIFTMLVLVLSLPVACSYYRSFSTNAANLDFTFEYPREWTISDLDDSGFRLVSPIPPDESPIQVGFSITLNPFPSSEIEASNNMELFLRYTQDERNFQIINQGENMFDGVSGQVVECTYDVLALPELNQKYIPIRKKRIELPRNNKVYEIVISGNQNQWSLWEKDINYFLDTFKWKR